jgi:hypothetical protein
VVESLLAALALFVSGACVGFVAGACKATASHLKEIRYLAGRSS